MSQIDVMHEIMVIGFFSLTLYNHKLYFPFSEGAGYYVFLQGRNKKPP